MGGDVDPRLEAVVLFLGQRAGILRKHRLGFLRTWAGYTKRASPRSGQVRGLPGVQPPHLWQLCAHRIFDPSTSPSVEPLMSKPIDRNISEALAKEQNDAKEKADKKKARRKGKQRATRLQSEQKAKR